MMNRCLVCNNETAYPLVFCSQECESEYKALMEEIADESDLLRDLYDYDSKLG